MDILTLIKSRKTSYYFTDKKPTKQQILKILEAARWAPSPHNSQLWSFIIIKKPKKINQLMQICWYGHQHSNPPLLIACVKEPASSFKSQKKAKLSIQNHSWMKFPHTH